MIISTGVINMLRSRVGLLIVVVLTSIATAAFACDGFFGYQAPSAEGGYVFGSSGNGDSQYSKFSGYHHNGFAYARCYSVRAHHHHGKFVPSHRVCKVHEGYAVCTKYVYSITPMHRDRQCSEWELKRAHHMHHVKYYYLNH
jgi:hypothetical protein